MALYAGLLLAPAENFGLWPTFFGPLAKKKGLLCCLAHFRPFLVSSSNLGNRRGKRQFFLPQQGLSKNYFTRDCVTCDQSEFATKQLKMCLRTSMSKIRLPHIYRSNNFVIINKKSSFDSNI